MPQFLRVNSLAIPQKVKELSYNSATPLLNTYISKIIENTLINKNLYKKMFMLVLTYAMR